MEQQRLKAKQSMDFDQFIDNLYVLIKLAWGEDWGRFTITKPTTSVESDGGRDVTMPHITYALKKLEPGMIGKNTREIKPRFREQLSKYHEATGEETLVNIAGQVVDCQVEFTIYGANNAETMTLSKELRDLLSTYKGFLMEKGMQNLWFKEDTDRNEEENLDGIVSRRVTYHVRLEDLIEEEIGRIKEITINHETVRNQLELEGALPSQQTWE